MIAGAIHASEAKINLVLKVGPRRPDGYHDVATLLCRVSLADTLTIAPAAVTAVSCPELPGGDTLVTRALSELCAACGHTEGFRVAIAKRVPVGAGLGGGSSNAATALRAANALMVHPLDERALLALAAGIGSDVPFFLGGPVAIATGRGERIAPGPPLPPAAVALAHPGRPLATRDVYEAHRPWRAPPSLSVPTITDVAALARIVENDLAPVAERLEPGCRTLREGLVARGALAASVTGSGSAVFGVFADEEDARRALDDLPGAAWSATATLSTR